MKTFLNDELFYFLKVSRSGTQHLFELSPPPTPEEKSTTKKMETQFLLSKNLQCTGLGGGGGSRHRDL